MANNTKTIAKTKIYNDLNLLFKTVNYDFNPVLSKAITQHNGIEILGTFTFSDYTTERVGPMCYVTVRRSDTDPYPHNGFGFAFCKMSYTETSSGIYNVYLVDNSPLIDEVFMYNQSVVQENGVNNFLVAASRPLWNDTTYRFKLRINEYNSARLWILGGSSEEDSVDLDTGLADSVYNSGINYSGYLATMSVRSYDYEPQANGSHFGIGVLGTQNGEWKFDDIKIQSIVDNYPFVYYNLKVPSSINGTNEPAVLEWDGYGVWGDSPYTNSSGIQLWIQQNNSPDYTWEKIGTHTWYPGAPISERKIRFEMSDIDSYNIGGYVNVYATTTEANAKGKVYTDYIHLSTDLPSGIHQGNMIDVYVKDNAKISRGVATSLTSDELLDISSIGPIIAIRGVSSGGVDLVEGDPDIGYIISEKTPEKAFSNQDSLSVITDAVGSFDVEYLYYNQGNTVQSFANTDSFRYPGFDVLVKYMPPVIITINNLEYSGGPEEEVMKTLIVDYINELTYEFNVSKLLLYMQSQGVSSFNLTSISITAEAYDYKRNLLSKQIVTNTYVISDLGVFVTDTDELSGLLQI